VAAAPRPLDARGELWQGLTKPPDETERFALDERRAIVAGIGIPGGPVRGGIFEGDP
jgi:hypothetical protein